MKVGLSFSGGLDSTTAALRLKRAGHEVVLHHVRWNNRAGMGNPQSKAAHAVAAALGLPIRLSGEYTTHDGIRWVPVFLAIMCELGTYYGYDAVAWGVSGANQYRRDTAAALAQGSQFRGELLFPVWGVPRSEQWPEIPQAVQPLIWACHRRRPVDGPPCGTCEKCKEDLRWFRASR